MNIVGKIVTLRAPEISDLDKLHTWSNDPEIWSLLGGWHFPFSSRSTENWIKSRDDNNLNAHVFCIDAPDVGLIGTANLVNIDWKNGTAFHGMMLGNVDMRGKGYALDTVMLTMRYTFEELGLYRLDGDMISSNARSIKFYIEKCGWKEEGIKKGWFYRQGQRFDKVVVGITKEEYYEHIKNHPYWL
jgi:RimJ/RimL family protein N-acetyltransferase